MSIHRLTPILISRFMLNLRNFHDDASYPIFEGEALQTLPQVKFAEPSYVEGNLGQPLIDDDELSWTKDMNLTPELPSYDLRGPRVDPAHETLQDRTQLC